MRVDGRLINWEIVRPVLLARWSIGFVCQPGRRFVVPTCSVATMRKW